MRLLIANVRYWREYGSVIWDNKSFADNLKGLQCQSYQRERKVRKLLSPTGPIHFSFHFHGVLGAAKLGRCENSPPATTIITILMSHWLGCPHYLLENE